MTSSPSPDQIHPQPGVSVIIPVYNSEPYLKECLDSLLGQTFDDWEAICINDGSTDGSAEILADYAARDPRIRVLSQENRGQGAARNYGMREAHGKYISFLDSDDYLALNFLEILHKEAQESGADVVVGSTSYESARRKGQSGIAVGTSLSSLTERVAALPHGGPCDKLYNSELLRQHNICFSEGVYWEDNPFAIKVCFYALKLSAASAAVYYYVLGQESTTRGVAQAAKRKTDSLIVAREIMKFCAEKGCSAEERSIVVAFCLRNFISKESLCDPDYYAELEGVLGLSQQLSALRRKAMRRERRKRWLTKLKSLWRNSPASSPHHQVASPDHEGRSLLFFMSQIVMGGVEKVLLTYLRRLQDTGRYTCAVVCLTQVKDPFFLNFFEEQKIPLYVVDKKIKRRRRCNFIARWTYRIYRTRMEYDISRNLERLASGFDVLIDFHNFACASYLRRLPQKKIGFCHGSIVFFMDRVKKKHLGIYDRMICLSHAFERDFKQVYPEWMDKICCIYNPIEAEKTCQLSHMHAPTYPQPYFVVVQRLEFDKDVPSVIRGFALFNKEYPGYRLVIVGEGAQRPELEKLAMDEAIGARIIFTGRLDNPYPVMSKASALILSSSQQVGEGFGQVLIEAQSLGVPAVSSDVPSAPAEILLGGEAGYLFEAGNPKSLAQTLRDVEGKPSERRDKIRKATKALERFNPTKTISQLEKILNFGSRGSQN